MNTPQDEIDQLKKLFNSKNIEFLKEDFAFSVATKIVKYKDPDLLKIWPTWVNNIIIEICEEYSKNGEFGYISNVGKVDHSEIIRELAALINKK